MNHRYNFTALSWDLPTCFERVGHIRVVCDVLVCVCGHLLTPTNNYNNYYKIVMAAIWTMIVVSHKVLFLRLSFCGVKSFVIYYRNN